MKIKELNLTNFRGIQRLELEFQPGINVIAGKNGVGKSGILDSMAVLLSQIARETGRISARSRQNFGVNDVRNGTDFLQADLVCETQNVPFRATLTKNREQVAVHRDDGRKPYSSGDISHDEIILRDEPRFDILPNEQFSDWDLFKNADKEEPFLAVYYATNRSYLRKISASTGRAKLNAYAGALSGDFIDLSEFGAWFDFITAVAPVDHSSELNDRFQEAITRFLPEFSNLRCQRHENNQDGKTSTHLQLSVEKAGKEFELQQLSDGERGILAIVLDLTRRLSLSHRRTTDPLGEGKAVVLIDEIDLHLHPSWQREILTRLEETFPNCQFIPTTHSPQVIGQTPAPNLIYLDHDGEGIERREIGAAFGRDTNWVLREIMGTLERDRETMEAIELLFQLVEQGNFQAARGKIENLRNQIGEDVELIAATTRIRRHEILKSRKG